MKWKKRIALFFLVFFMVCIAGCPPHPRRPPRPRRWFQAPPAVDVVPELALYGNDRDCLGQPSAGNVK